jgi:hypothetical protein
MFKTEVILRHKAFTNSKNYAVRYITSSDTLHRQATLLCPTEKLQCMKGLFTPSKTYIFQNTYTSTGMEQDCKLHAKYTHEIHTFTCHCITWPSFHCQIGHHDNPKILQRNIVRSEIASQHAESFLLTILTKMESG